MTNIMMYIILLIMVLVSVAFITLLERRILGYIQVRKGPNKVGYGGVLQPIADALKLFSKENNKMLMFNKMIYSIIPLVGLFLMLSLWIVVLKSGEFIILFSMVYILVISSFMVYVILLSGWSSNSKYALLGAYRGVAQTISYEVIMSFLMVSMFMYIKSLSLKDFDLSLTMLGGYLLLLIIWMVTILAETSRSPFDLMEGESELVSGFNVEYGSGYFALLFMMEYGSVLFFSYLTSVMFFSYGYKVYLMFSLIVMLFLLLRGTLVRVRYDILMMMVWKVMLPFILLLMLVIIGL